MLELGNDLCGCVYEDLLPQFAGVTTRCRKHVFPPPATQRLLLRRLLATTACMKRWLLAKKKPPSKLLSGLSGYA